MIESLQLIHELLETVLEQTSTNHPMQEYLIRANDECKTLITNEKLEYYDSIEYYESEYDYED